MRPPRALLLDFGGVVVETASRPGWLAELAGEVHTLIGGALPLADVEVDLMAAKTADRSWKDAMSRPFAPAEMTHRMFWGDFVAADWPPSARESVLAHATALCKRMGELRQARKTRDGIPELLAFAESRGVRAAVVSNALSGAVHRDYLDTTGLAGLFALQVYSDEVGVRKPNPEMIWIATRALGVDPAEAWYVGDNYDRDVVCGVRAGAGATVLMVAKDTEKRPYRVRQEPDAVVAGPAELHELLEETL